MVSSVHRLGYAMCTLNWMMTLKSKLASRSRRFQTLVEALGKLNRLIRSRRTCLCIVKILVFMNLRKQNQALQNLFSTGKSFLCFWSGLKSVCIQIIMYCLSSAATYLPNNP